MLTLIFNDEIDCPIIADNMSYSITYNAENKNEEVRAVLTAGNMLNQSMANLTYFGGRDITKLSVKYSEENIQEFHFERLRLNSIDTFISVESQSASFYMSRA